MKWCNHRDLYYSAFHKRTPPTPCSLKSPTGPRDSVKESKTVTDVMVLTPSLPCPTCSSGTPRQLPLRYYKGRARDASLAEDASVSRFGRTQPVFCNFPTLHSMWWSLRNILFTVCKRFCSTCLTQGPVQSRMMASMCPSLVGGSLFIETTHQSK